MIDRPFGSWTSPITAELISSGGLRLSQPRIDGDAVYWVEGRAAEAGRQVVARRRVHGVAEDVTPAESNARTRVHEYGGGDYAVREGVLFYVDFESQRIHRLDPGAAGARPITPEGPRYADLEVSPDGRFVAAVEERPRDGAEPDNGIVLLPAEGGEPHRVVTGRDFASFPRFSPAGDRLAYTVWDHPAMPWDETELYVVPLRDGHIAGPARHVAGGAGESVFQPGFSPRGDLTFVSDRTGFWNLYRDTEQGPAPLCPRAADFGRPQWVFGMSTWAWVAEEALLCVMWVSGRERLCHLDTRSGALRELDLPFTVIEGLRARGSRAVFVGATPQRASAVCSFDAATESWEFLRESVPGDLDAELVSVPEAVEFSTSGGGVAHGFLYRPRNPDGVAPSGERPPLLVKTHGGPTSAATSALDLRTQYWTTRGFAVADVNYRGSSGYGRCYRDLLRGAWGVADVDDCVAAARFAAGEGLADGSRLAISGGSAGGYTTLCALTFRDEFGAGASHYGIGDLEALARDTHKFEARYLDGLVGPIPDAIEIYRERSPIHHTERLRCPVIFFQGLEDRVVPPSQARAMADALAARRIPHALVEFEGEGHGFRRAENIRFALDAELAFYARVFGFPADASAAAPEIRFAEELPGTSC